MKKGQTWGMEIIFKIVIIMVVFTGAVLLMVGAMGGLNEFLEQFCLKNPSWCGELKDCVCCKVSVNKNPQLPFKSTPIPDLYENEYVWATRDKCNNLLNNFDGEMLRNGDEEYELCGYTPDTSLSTGFIFRDVCGIPEEYIGEVETCICCNSSDTGVIEWDVDWKCELKNGTETYYGSCGALWTYTRKNRFITTVRIGKATEEGNVCDIPYPYNITESP